MELVLLFFNSFMVGFSGAMMPGPLLAVGIAETPRHGWQTGSVISVGHAIAEIAVVVVLSLGLAVLIEKPLVTGLIGIVGGTALIYMGINMGYGILKRKVSYETTSQGKKSHHKLAGEGITATLSNPYWFVWWGTTGLAFLVKSLKFGFVGPVVFYFGHILSDFVWYTFVSVLLWTGKKLIMGTGLRPSLMGRPTRSRLVRIPMRWWISGTVPGRIRVPVAVMGACGAPDVLTGTRSARSAAVAATPVTGTIRPTTTSTLPILPVADTPVTETSAFAATVTDPTAPVADTPVTEKLASAVTVTDPTAPVADRPEGDVLASATTVTDPTAPVADRPEGDALASAATVTEPTAPVLPTPVKETVTPEP